MQCHRVAYVARNVQMYRVVPPPLKSRFGPDTGQSITVRLELFLKKHGRVDTQRRNGSAAADKACRGAKGLLMKWYGLCIDQHAPTLLPTSSKACPLEGRCARILVAANIAIESPYMGVMFSHWHPRPLEHAHWYHRSHYGSFKFPRPHRPLSAIPHAAQHTRFRGGRSMLPTAALSTCSRACGCAPCPRPRAASPGSLTLKSRTFCAPRTVPPLPLPTDTR